MNAEIDKVLRELVLSGDNFVLDLVKRDEWLKYRNGFEVVVLRELFEIDDGELVLRV